ncbi:MAG: DsbA family protein [Candidatus Pacebacteria bacterium]|nr:DsbA family protein [Candidatus Paceibacterota bacterium]
MIKFLKKDNKRSVRIFVVLSLFAFFLLFFLLIILSLQFFQPQVDILNSKFSDDNKVEDKFIDKSKDPFIVYPILESELNKSKQPEVSDNNPIYGNSQAELNIVYYSDYDCKYCLQQVETLKAVVDKYDNQINLVWKDYPELDYESLSFKAAVAGRCASLQGQFWPFQKQFHKQFSIFKTEDGSSSQAFDDFVLGIAKSLDLKERDFKSCFSNLETKTLILEDVAEAQKLEIVGVPFTFIGDREILGEYNREDIEFLIKNKLE